MSFRDFKAGFEAARSALRSPSVLNYIVAGIALNLIVATAIWTATPTNVVISRDSLWLHDLSPALRALTDGLITARPDHLATLSRLQFFYLAEAVMGFVVFLALTRSLWKVRNNRKALLFCLLLHFPIIDLLFNARTFGFSPLRGDPANTIHALKYAVIIPAIWALCVFVTSVLRRPGEARRTRGL